MHVASCDFPLQGLHLAAVLRNEPVVQQGQVAGLDVRGQVKETEEDVFATLRTVAGHFSKLRMRQAGPPDCGMFENPFEIVRSCGNSCESHSGHFTEVSACSGHSTNSSSIRGCRFEFFL